MASLDSLLFLIHHVFLPPQLPQEDDSKNGLGNLFITTLIDALQKFSTSSSRQHNEIKTLMNLLRNAQNVHDATTNDLQELDLRKALGSMAKQGGYLPLYVKAQNAGMLVSGDSGCLKFEIFELSPLSEGAMATKGRLRRSFPATATSVSPEKAHSPDFQAAVAHTLSSMSFEAVAGMQPKIRKAREMHDEERDSTHPFMVSEYFHGILIGLGESVVFTPMTKNTREEILWKNAKLPWRRSALWLLLRVSLQLCCVQATGSMDAGRKLYKNVMLNCMSHIVRMAQPFHLSTDLLLVLSAKLTRRLHKIGDEIDEITSKFVKIALEENTSVMSQRWTAIQLQNAQVVNLASLVPLDFNIDCLFSISQLDNFITGITTRQKNKQITDFEPDSNLMEYDSRILPNDFDDHSNEESFAQNLHGFENWVEQHLQSWLRTHMDDASACSQLGHLIKKYHSVAEDFYRSNPESMSRMVLVLLELWVACDKIGVSVCPLLSRYSPGISGQPLQSLLLPFKTDMERLHCVEEYLAMRAQAPRPSSEVFATTDNPAGFGAQYFDDAPELQALMKSIIDDANELRKAKVGELRRLKTEYQRLMAKYEEAKCDFYEYTDRWTGLLKERHCRRCKRCSYKTQAKELQITVHEWPLPENNVTAKTVIFELQLPSWLMNWRDSTALITLDVLKYTYSARGRPNFRYTLWEDQQLQSRHSRGTAGTQSQRIGLLSQAKAHLRTHRNKVAVATSTNGDVCVRSGLKYEYFDSKTDCFVVSVQRTEILPRLCTYLLASPSFQKFIFRPANAPNGPAPNVTIAKQSECPHGMPLSQWRTLSSIPLGYHLSWWNVALQLRMPLVDFKQTDTALAILQCIYQSGPPCDGSDTRPSHWLAGEDSFASEVLVQLKTSLQRIRENWESSQALNIFIAIARRLLSLNSNEAVRAAYLSFLKEARVVASEWVTVLQGKATAAQPNDRGEFVSRCALVALICVSTYDIDRQNLPTVLDAAQDASTLIQCCITIQQGGRGLRESSDTAIRLLYSRHLRLLRDALPILVANQDGLHNAIYRSWPGYRRGSDWAAVDTAPNWVVTQTSSIAMNVGSVVHYDLLSGNLLVSGQPLGRLPSNYEKHPSYGRLFGDSLIEVMPSNSAGLVFSATTLYSGCEINFGITTTASTSSGDLLVQAMQKSSGETLDLLPKHLFQRLVPTSFVRDYVHWYNHNTKEVEFRPVSAPWTRDSPKEWRLVKDGDCQWRLIQPRSGSFLVCAKSATARFITKILSPLALPLSIHIILHPSLCCLDIEIPGLRIGFGLKKGSSTLNSREFPGMCVDGNQTLGTLVGFENKLLLKSQYTSERKVLLLEGQFSCRTHVRNASNSSEPLTDHVEVCVQQETAVKIHTFDVDKHLGRLVDNGSMHSKLVLSYLHALTSHCMPDPLTCNTGTEEALTILNSAAVKSFDKLTSGDIKILQRIADDLTPKRQFYPKNEKVMQSVEWSSKVGFMSQHGGFYTAVTAILDLERRYNDLCRESVTEIPRILGVDTHLLERDCIRSAAFRISSYGAEDHSAELDHVYKSRDRVQQSERRANAYNFSSLVCQGRITLNFGRPSSSTLWKVLSQTTYISGPTCQLDTSRIKYGTSAFGIVDHFLPRAWACLHRALSVKQPINKFSLIMWLSSLALFGSTNKGALELIGMFQATETFADISPPQREIFNVSEGYEFSDDVLERKISANRRSFGECPESNLVKDKVESQNDFVDRVGSMFENQGRSAVQNLLSALKRQWPCEEPRKPEVGASVDFNTYIDVASTMRDIRPIFQTWYHNLELFQYLQRLETRILQLDIHTVEVPFPRLSQPHFIASRAGFVRSSDLVARPAPCLNVTFSPLPVSSSAFERERDMGSLNSFVNDLERGVGSSEYERQYIAGLKDSVSCLMRATPPQNYQLPSYDVLEAYSQNCNEQERKLYDLLKSAASPNYVDHPSFKIIAESYGWPRVSRKFFLLHLARHKWNNLTLDWKTCIVHYAIAVTHCHRAERLLRASRAGKTEDLINELRNNGHQNWNPMNYPERLLLEVESKIMIRDVQSDVAKQMEDPESARSTSMQLNMGEGKSSVIVPIVASALASNSRLVRVIVGKPQSRQMMQMLISKVGGMLDRRLYHMPFSRKLKLNEDAAIELRKMCLECMEGGDILLLQPEHILSFQSMGLEKCITGSETIGRALLQTQGFFDDYSRDIVDESDENFSVKFELIYSMGQQRCIDASPDRWLCIQEILDLVRTVAPIVADELPLSMEIGDCPSGGFPRIRILRAEAETLLIKKMADRICDLGLAGFPISRQSPSIRKAVFIYITKRDLTKAEIDTVEGASSIWAESIQPTLFLLRGLLACGILAFVFHQKRWRVNYGLDSIRKPTTRLAVPYRAKDMPTSRSEFSHPDVVILLTSLSYYYGSLTDNDLWESFNHLSQSDQKDVEYDIWIKCIADLPHAFRQLDGINLQDRVNCTSDVFPKLRYSKKVIDYFLSNIVFPKEMKEFPEKLSASGWDLGKQKTHFTTAFSGTSDSRILLPVDVDYFDSQQQRHTNALVLGYILQPENSVAMMPAAVGSGISDAERLLSTVMDMKPPPRVILDAGAQIIEMGNREVARAWLELYPGDGVRAAVFVNEDDELSVFSREGGEESLQTSPFANQLDACLVFLDQAHTRGIDLSLPRDYQAAVTLGPNLTKDRLVQACMRMRQLGKGQSVIFCVTEEIRSKIHPDASELSEVNVSVADVLRWTISETCAEIKQSLPLWAEQGRRFIRHEKIWSALRDCGWDSVSSKQATAFMEPEAQSLESRYRPNLQSSDSMLSTHKSSNASREAQIWERCKIFRDLSFHESRLQEEQERELSPEIQQERQIQRPQSAKAAKHYLHADVLKFVSTGKLVAESKAYMPAFATLTNISPAKIFPAALLSKDRQLLVTKDFACTVESSGASGAKDDYLRPVQWILTTVSKGSNRVKCALIISPFEAQLLFPSIRRSKVVVLHSYQPRWNRAFDALDQLNFFTVPTLETPREIPPPLVAQLNIFAGQLYYSDLRRYQETCSFLGLASEGGKDEWTIGADGFIQRDSNGKVGASSGLSKSPVAFLKAYTELRKDGEDIGRTHVGKMLNGMLLCESEFD